MMQFKDFKDWVLLGLITCGIYILWDMKKSVELLNTSVAIVIERSAWQEKLLNTHEERLRSLEKEK